MNTRRTMTLAAGTMMMATWALLAAQGCADPAREVEARVKALEAAVRYHDPGGLYALHVESRGQGLTCAGAGAALYRKAAAAATEQGCREAARVLADPAPFDEEARLLAEIIADHCQHPGGDCQDFSRRTFERRARASRLWTRRVSAITTAQVRVEDQTATAYIDIIYEEGEPDRVALDFKRLEDAWWLTSYPW